MIDTDIHAGPFGETACAACGGPCLDHNDGVGISRGGESICGTCAEPEGGWEEDQGWKA